MAERKEKERGAILLFLVAAIAVMSMWMTTLIPMSRASYPERKQRVTWEMIKVGMALQDFHFDYKSFPSDDNSISDSDFYGKFTSMGWMSESDGHGYTHHDPFGPLMDSGATKVYTETSRSDRWADIPLYSMGPNYVDNSAGSDDIVLTIQGDLYAEARTRRLLSIIYAAVHWYDPAYDGNSNLTLEDPDLGNTSDGWAGWDTTGECEGHRGLFILPPEFDTDGWDTEFIIDQSTPSAPEVYSAGPDRTDDSMGDDDITWD